MRGIDQASKLAAAAWTGSTAQALAGAESLASVYLDPPVDAAVAMLKTTFEQETGLSIGQLAGLAGDLQALSKMTDPVAIAATIGDVVSGACQIVADVGDAAGLVSDVAGVVPVLGQIIDVACGVIGAVIDLGTLDYDPTAKWASCDKELAERVRARCASPDIMPQIIPTGAGGPTPADVFRPLVKWSKTGGGWAMPLCPASVWVALCGDAADGLLKFRLTDPAADNWEVMAKDERDFLLSGGTGKLPKLWQGKFGPGIPRPIRDQMWRCIKAILSAVEPTEIGNIHATRNDGGRTMMAVLQDLLRVQIDEGRKAAPRFGVTEAFVEQVGRLVAKQYHWAMPCTGNDGSTAAAGVYASQDDCQHVDIVKPVLNGIRQFEAVLRDQFIDTDGTWRTAPRRGAGVKPSRTVKLGEASLGSFIRTLGKTPARGGLVQSDVTPEAATGGLVLLAAAGLAWLALRKGRA